jgi:hypothetical protein
MSQAIQERIRMSIDEWVNQAIEILPTDDEQFLIIKETLERIGIPSFKDGKKKLSQSCHIYQKRGKFYIVHFKEMFLIDGKDVNFSEDDKLRRNLIAFLLQEWGFLKVIKPEMIEDRLPHSSVKVVSFKEKPLWTLNSKYTVGNIIK